MKFEITLDQINALLNYLSQRPYAEVYQLISLLSNLPRVVIPERPAGPVKDEPDYNT